MTSGLLRLGFGLAIALLTSCTGTPPETDDMTLERLPRSSVNWSAAGKAAIVSPEGQRTANLRWQRLDPNRDRLQISGPIGLGALILEREYDQVTWRDGDKQRPLYTLPVNENTWSAVADLPMTELGAWLLGYTDDAGTWEVDVLNWQTVAQHKVPRTLVLSREDLNIRLKLLDWRVNP